MFMSVSVCTEVNVNNYALDRRLPGLLTLKMKLLPSCETSVAIYYSTRWNFPPDLNIQRHCSEKLTSLVHITECCNTTEVLPIFAFQSKRILSHNAVSGTTDVEEQVTNLQEFCFCLQLYFRQMNVVSHIPPNYPRCLSHKNVGNPCFMEYYYFHSAASLLMDH